MKSMTGYGYSEYQDENHHLIVELKAYNNRYLDIVVNLPPMLGPLEPRLRRYIGGFVNRGRVELHVRLRELQEDISVIPDMPAVKAYAAALQGVQQEMGLKDELRLSHLLRFEGLLKPVKNRDLEALGERIEGELEKCRRQFEAERLREGAETQADIRGNLAVIQEAAQFFALKAQELEAGIRDNIRARFEELLGSETDENRVLAETAVLLMKYSIGEEIARLKGHLESFNQEFEQEGPVGKKLDFICQEINRETNTIGSKSTLLEVNQRVVVVKDSLEKIREQLRNVE